MAWGTKRMNNSGRRGIATAIVVFLILLTRLGWEQIHWQHAAQQRLEAGDLQVAVVYLGRVLNAHIPFSPIETKALTTLRTLASEFDGEGDRQMALRCYETARSSRFLSRHFRVPDAQLVRRIEPEIARIKASAAVKSLPDRGYQMGYRDQYAAFSREFTPSVYWSALAVSSCFIYVWMVVRALQRGNFRRQGFFALAMFTVWMVALFLA